MLLPSWVYLGTLAGLLAAFVVVRLESKVAYLIACLVAPIVAVAVHIALIWLFIVMIPEWTLDFRLATFEVLKTFLCAIVAAAIFSYSFRRRRTFL